MKRRRERIPAGEAIFFSYSFLPVPFYPFRFSSAGVSLEWRKKDGERSSSFGWGFQSAKVFPERGED